jgi:hypothetical protein
MMDNNTARNLNDIEDELIDVPYNISKIPLQDD